MIRVLVALLMLATSVAASAHDHWINGKRNGAGEWCCGEGDCFVTLAIEVGNYWVILDTGEILSKGTELPSLDGQFWRCKHPDGTLRCFFVPPPSG